MKFSSRVEEMQFSPIRKFNPIAAKVKAEGKKVYHLNIGQPDVETPECFMDAIRAYDAKVIKYAESGGIPELQDAVVDYFKEYGIDYEKGDLIVTNGGSEALTMAFLALVDPGDEIIIAEPFYTNYNTFLQTSGGSIRPITTKGEDGFRYATREQIEPLINEHTRAVCCITPGNPTGNVLTKDEMLTICRIAKEHDIMIIADEVYREFTYDGREVTSFGMFPEYADHVIIVDSVSKRFSACGARVGVLASKNREFMSNAMKIAQARLCVATIDQIGAAQLFRMPREYYAQVRDEYCARRDAVYEEMSRIPGVVCQKPGGALYMTVKLPVDNVEKFLVFMLEEFEDNGETAMFAPAEGFYATEGLGRDEIRIAFCLNQHDMRRGAELIRLGIEAYNKKQGK